MFCLIHIDIQYSLLRKRYKVLSDVYCVEFVSEIEVEKFIFNCKKLLFAHQQM